MNGTKGKTLGLAEFWRETAIQLVHEVLDRQGFRKADHLLDVVMARVNGKAAQEDENPCEESACQLIEDFERLAVKNELILFCGARDGLACSRDFTGRCAFCDDAEE